MMNSIVDALRHEEKRLEAQLAAIVALIAAYTPPRTQCLTARIRQTHRAVRLENPNITPAWANEMTAERVGCALERVVKVTTGFL